MSLHDWHRLARRLAGVLLAAWLLATLAPAISRGLAAGADPVSDPLARAHWVELCTDQGMQRVWADAPPAPADSTPAHLDRPPAPADSTTAHLDRCGHCLLQAERFAPLLPGLPALPVVSVRVAIFVGTLQPDADAPRHTARARGPPLLG
jgi:hypothetical protein